MESRKGIHRRLLLVLVSFIISSILGCSSPVVLHVIDKQDIFSISKGTQIENITVDRDGWFLSDKYLEAIGAEVK